MSTHNNVHETAADAGNSRAMESRDHLSNGVSLKNFRSRGNFIQKVCVALFVACTGFFVGCNSFSTDINSFSNTEFIKNSILADVDYSISIGDAFDNYQYFYDTEWREFKSAQGREIVEFRGILSECEEIVIIQFILNKDLREDDEGSSFRIGYIGYSDIYETENGWERKEKKATSYQSNAIIKGIYNNKEW